MILCVLGLIPVLFIKSNEMDMKLEVIVVDTLAIQALKVTPPCKEVAEAPEREIPSFTKFKVSDWVCAWGKWSGVVIDIRWGKKHNVLVYKVQHLTVEDEWKTDEYYDTEITAGKCN